MALDITLRDNGSGTFDLDLGDVGGGPNEATFACKMALTGVGS